MFQNFWYMHCEIATGKDKATLPGLLTPATAVTRTGLA
jgi:hypothetical protein